MHSRVLLVCLCLVFAAAGGLYANQQPTDEKGFQPGKAYDFHGLDSVNLFNGNLNIRIPLGPTYSVSEHLKYSFALTYAGNTWDRSSADTHKKNNVGLPTESCDEIPDGQTWAEPSRDSNAGIGWLFTFGQLGVAGEDEQAPTNNYCTGQISNAPPQTPYLTTSKDYAPSYLAPDGSVHEFHLQMRHGTPAVQDTFYSVGGTYMRLKRFRYPSQQVEKYELELADGNVHEFGPDGMLRKMSDRFGNAVTIAKDSPAAPAPLASACAGSYTSWTIDDGFRKHYAYFETRALNAANPRREPYTKRLCQLNVAAFDSSEGANYLFFYDRRVISRQHVPYEVAPDATQIGPTVTVPLLTEIRLPDGTSYRAVYDIGRAGSTGLSSSDVNAVPTDYSSFGSSNPGDFTGHLTKLVLPTLGELHWTYQTYLFPRDHPPDPEPPYDKGAYRPTSAGVAKRRLVDGARDDEWSYDSRWLSNGYTGITSVTTTRAPDNTITESFFTNCTTCPIGVKREEYGLPISRHPVTEGPGPNPYPVAGINYYMSSRTLFPDGRVRTSYVTYDTEWSWNPRVTGRTTVFENGDVSTVRYSDFDGLGHFRRSETTGFGTSTPRISFTNYNPGRGTYPSSTLPGSAEAWIIGNFDYVETTEGTAVERSELCFDGNTGFLNRRRVRRYRPNAETADFLTIYRDADASGAADGNVSVEELYGGDGTPLASTATCTFAFSNPPFALEHTYSNGVRATSKYSGMPYKTLDVEVDASGLVAQTYDTARVPAAFRYDSSARLKGIQGPAAWTEYVYTNATTAAPASVTVRQCPNGSASCPNTSLTESRNYYDGFGRLSQQRTRMAAGQWTVTWTTYDAFDRIVSTSVPTLRTSGAFEPMPDGTKVSTSTYDPVGRVVLSKAPDGTCTDFGYDGVRKVTASVSLGACTEPARATSVETFDTHGRLRSVDEGDAPDATHVDYGYVFDRMTSVSFGDQQRTFEYDGAGLLVKETHPESGTIEYPAYNALGDVLQRRPADCEYNLDYVYDDAGRLVTIEGGCAAAGVLKQFFYGSDSTPGDKRLGKLTGTTRWNRTPLGLFGVSETFTYGDAPGRVTRKETSVAKIGFPPQQIQKFAQEYQYDELDAVQRASHPVCLTTACGEATNDGVHYTYSNGLLTGVAAAQVDPTSSAVPPLTATQTLGTLAYHPTTQLKHIAHANEVDEYLDADPNGLPRVGAIRVEGFSECAAPQINSQPANADVPYNETATLAVTTTPGGPYWFQWYTVGAGDSRTAIAGAISNTYTTPPVTETVTYAVAIRSSCGIVWSNDATVVPQEQQQLDPPTALVAAKYGASSVAVTWIGAAGATSYDVERRTGATFGFLANTTGTNYIDGTCPAGATCIYRVRAKATGSLTSEPSNQDLMTRIALTSLAADNGRIKVVHLTELLAALNALRAASNSGAVTWAQILPPLVPAPAAGGLMENEHVLALRTWMNEALLNLGFATPPYTDPTLDKKVVKAVHIEDLRGRTQ